MPVNIHVFFLLKFYTYETNYERIRWEATTILYGDMNVYRDVMGRNEVWFWWHFVEKRQYILNSALCS